MGTTTQSTASTPQTLETLAARRAQAQAALEAADASERAKRAQIEARAAEEEMERRQRQARTAELAAQLGEVDRYVEAQRQREYDEVQREVERRQETLERARAFINEKPMAVPMSREETEQFWAQLDREAERRELAEQDELRQHIDRCESRRLWDAAYRRRYDFHHPGGADQCDCPGHRAWRREAP